MLSTLRRDIQAVKERDPAARSTLEIALCYSGLHAIWVHRIAHWLWNHNLKLLARWMAQVSRCITGIEIHPGAHLGPGFFIDHGMGVVIGETAEIGRDVTVYHGVTLGGTSWQPGKRHPTLEDNVVVGAGAKVLGDIVVGAGARVGANAVVVKSVPPDSVVVGVPGQVVTRSKKPTMDSTPQGGEQMPDTIGVTLVSLMQRVEQLERNSGASTPANHPHHLANGHETVHHPSVPSEGVWRGEDFSI